MQEEVEGHTLLCGLSRTCIGLVLGDETQEVGEGQMQDLSRKGGVTGLRVLSGGETVCVFELSSRANPATLQ